MLFKETPKLLFNQRVPLNHGNPELAGYVKHYGKAISISEWEKTCKYYIYHRWAGINKKLLNRWMQRVGNAIHNKSDFGNDLIKWKDKESLGIPLKN